MKPSTPFSSQITAQVRVRIVPTRPFAETDSFYAINWFDLKRPALYRLYNKLVGPLLLNVGGGLQFKGKRLETLEGTDADDRTMLLLVYYPNPAAFLALLGRKLFQLASVLRNRSVERFNLGYMHALKKPLRSAPGAAKEYLIHHFNVESDLREAQLAALQQLAQSLQIKLYFAGQLAANLEVERGKEITKVPLPMDGLLLWEAKAATDWQALIGHVDYQQFTSELSSSYQARFERIR